MPPVGSFTITNTSPNIRGKQWAVLGQFRPISKGVQQSRYLTVIVFQNISFKEEASKANPIRIEVFPNVWRYMKVPVFSKTQVLVTCTCPDYYWAWWWYVDSVADSHSGIDPPHPSKVTGHTRRVTDGQPYGTIPGSRNDKQAAGVCKHIIALAVKLHQQKMII